MGNPKLGTPVLLELRNTHGSVCNVDVGVEQLCDKVAYVREGQNLRVEDGTEDEQEGGLAGYVEPDDSKENLSMKNPPA